MSYIRRMICLAASNKLHQLCYAGKDVGDGTWIRPVTTHGEHEVSHAEATNSAGALTKVGDIVDITYRVHQPFAFQQENHLIDATVRWTKVGTADWEQMAALVDRPARLWDRGSASGGYRNNRVPEVLANRYGESLYLIRPQGLTISVARKGGDYDPDKRLVRAHFNYAGTPYVLAVTDPKVEKHLRNGPDRRENYDGALLCISLGGAFHGFAYKLVAAVIQPQ